MPTCGKRAMTLGAFTVAATMTGTLLSDAGAISPATPETLAGPAAAKPLETLITQARASSPLRGGKRKDTNRPNVVTIMVDDMRADELNKPWMKRTRKLLARKGVRFRNSFAPSPLCAPARASFLTGKYVHNHGVRGTHRPYGFRAFRDRNTLPVWLRRGGYRTIHLGKYINGYGKQRRRSGRPSTRYVPPGWTDWRASLDSKGTYRYWNTHLNKNGKIRSLRGRYQTKAYGKIARRTIRRYSGRRKPFFLNLWFTAPHHGKPREADDPRRAKTPARLPSTVGDFKRATRRLPDPDGEPGNKRKPSIVSARPKLNKQAKRAARKAYRQRAQALSTVDRQVRRVVRTLRRQGELKETYIIFTSDNGYLLGEARRTQGKTLPYPASSATPTLIRGPGIPRGKVRRDAFTSIDFAPTIADMANVKRRGKVDGKSLLRTAKRGNRGWRRPILTNTGAKRGKRSLGQGVRVPGYLYAKYKVRGRKRELYNLRRDPRANRNLIGKKNHRFTQRRLNKLLKRRKDCAGKQCRKPLPRYQR